MSEYRSPISLLKSLGLIALLLSVSACNAEHLDKDSVKVESIDAGVLTIKDSGGTFNEQVRAFFLVRQLQTDPNNLLEQIKKCRLAKHSGSVVDPVCGALLYETRRTLEQNAAQTPLYTQKQILKAMQVLMDASPDTLAQDVIVLTPMRKPKKEP